MKVQFGTVNSGVFVMDYCRFGNGRRFLVILPGLSVQSVMPSADAIAAEYGILTDDYTIYVFDRRKDPPDPYTVQDMAYDTARAMRSLNLKGADLFGASQGGMIAMVIASDYPELVHKLILGSSSARISEEQFPLFQNWIRLAGEGNAKELYLSFAEAVYPAKIFKRLRDFLIESADAVTKDELARFVIMAEGMKGFDLTGKLSQITCPVLVIGSEDDAVLGGDASRQIADCLKNSAHCELYLYDGWGHAAYDCAPDYRERMRSFLLDSEV